MTFHGPTMAPGRATLPGTAYGGATWAPGAGNGVRAYDAKVRSRACLIVVALLVTACSGGASGPIVSTAPAPPAAGASATSATAATPSSVQTTTAPARRAQSRRRPGRQSRGPWPWQARPSRTAARSRRVSPVMAGISRRRWPGRTCRTGPSPSCSRCVTSMPMASCTGSPWNIPATTTNLKAGASGDLPGDAGEGRSDFGGAQARLPRAMPAFRDARLRADALCPAPPAGRRGDDAARPARGGGGRDRPRSGRVARDLPPLASRRWTCDSEHERTNDMDVRSRWQHAYQAPPPTQVTG